MDSEGKTFDRKKSKKRNSFAVEGGRKHRHVTPLPVKYQNVNVSGDVTKIEVMLEEAPDEAVLAGSIPSELDAGIELNSTYPGGVPEAGAVVVRAEEALIVVLVLVLWVAAIALFFNRWGKIRMLEPYQPKFQQQHRQSCTMVDMNALTHRTYSKFNIHRQDHPVHQSSCVPSTTTAECWRPRQNSVFVGSSSASLVAVNQETPRRAKSAFDLQSLVLAECTVRKNTIEDDRPENEEPGGTVRSSKELAMALTTTAGSQFTESSKVGQRRTSVCKLLDKPLQQRERGMSVCQVDRGDYQILQSRTSQRDRGMSICYFDRTDVLARPLQRDHRGSSSICHFDRMDVFARPPYPRDRGSSVCQFDRMDVLARPTSSYLGKSLLRERRVSVCNFLEKNEEPVLRATANVPANVSQSFQWYGRSSVDSNVDKIETILRSTPSPSPVSKKNARDNKDVSPLIIEHQGGDHLPSDRRDDEENGIAYYFDRPSCSKTPDVVLGYKATCV
ncbi:uncharacterized protein LOC118448998 isoform X1 [Vespa mandarinia]|uniref:uncharacterized protein LOC118448998 isoform X1 n=2 Tax=Vespa mandarinia TaxID=7446 RepID=UPI00162240BE|nr:uncharacterized protein LOC118448998 isoform X1 [Vespa mandarinia]